MLIYIRVLFPDVDMDTAIYFLYNYFLYMICDNYNKVTVKYLIGHFLNWSSIIELSRVRDLLMRLDVMQLSIRVSVILRSAVKAVTKISTVGTG